MRLPDLDTLRDTARRGRRVLQRAVTTLGERFRRPLAGRFQHASHTLPDRYPWLFRFVAAELGDPRGLRILSFGCSRGDEVFSLRQYFPMAALRGIDIDPSNIAHCRSRARRAGMLHVSFEAAATTEAEPTASYDAIFCLAVLCLGALTTQGAQRSDPLLHFADFERMVTDFARCLKPGGLLLLHTTNFRFSDTTVAQQFDTVLEADPADLAPDVKFDRHNRLLPGERYRAVAFRKHLVTR
jgi:2-polyprenyl-3-methyl-5-hydroxy-6-metoxy-1,4-benzoquinol methylase